MVTRIQNTIMFFNIHIPLNCKDADQMILKLIDLKLNIKKKILKNYKFIFKKEIPFWVFRTLGGLSVEIKKN